MLLLARYSPLAVLQGLWSVAEDDYEYFSFVPTPTVDLPTKTQTMNATQVGDISFALWFEGILELLVLNKTLLAVIIVGLCWWRYHLIAAPVRLFYSKQTTNITVMDGKDKRQIPMDLHVKRNCPALSDPRHNVFHPHFLLGNGHLQTIAASFASRITPQRVQFDREMLKMNDGGVVSLDWAKSGFTNDKLVLILHGLTGGSHETYVQDLILELQDMGLNSVVMNFRGCADTEVVTPQLYSGHYTGDITETVEHILKKKDYRMIGVGFSLGSNVLINYAGTMGNKCPLLACVSVGNPYDFMGAMLALHRSWLGRVYSYKMGQSLADMFDKHKHHFEDKLDLDAIRNVKDIVSFDHLATAPIGGYKTVHDYYRKASSVQRIPDITIPTLLFTAVDDPIAHQELIPWYEVEANPNIILATTSKGGHLGWYRDGWDNIIPTKRWFQRPVAEYIQCMFQLAPKEKPKPPVQITHIVKKDVATITKSKIKWTEISRLLLALVLGYLMRRR